MHPHYPKAKTLLFLKDLPFLLQQLCKNVGFRVWGRPRSNRHEIFAIGGDFAACHWNEGAVSFGGVALLKTSNGYFLLDAIKRQVLFTTEDFLNSLPSWPISNSIWLRLFDYGIVHATAISPVLRQQLITNLEFSNRSPTIGVKTARLHPRALELSSRVTTTITSLSQE